MHSNGQRLCCLATSSQQHMHRHQPLNLKGDRCTQLIVPALHLSQICVWSQLHATTTESSASACLVFVYVCVNVNIYIYVDYCICIYTYIKYEGVGAAAQGLATGFIQINLGGPNAIANEVVDKTTGFTPGPQRVWHPTSKDIFFRLVAT